MKSRIFNTFFLLLTLIFFFPSSFFAQENGHQEEYEFCATDILHKRQMEKDSIYRNRYEELQQKTVEIIKGDLKATTENRSSLPPVYTIPVVVHVIHETGTPVGTAENLSDAAITALIADVNDDFRHTSGLTFANPFSGMDAEIEFCLAVRDPLGNATTGINRQADDLRTIFDYLDEDNNPVPSLQEVYYWNPLEYYNIYIIKDIIGAGGFAYYSSAHGTAIDGAVVQYTASAGVWTHELGHAMNLPHTFEIEGDCTNTNCLTTGDFVCDTPPKLDSGFGGGTCATATNSCSTDENDTSANNPYRPIAMGGMGDQADLFENYMDYTSSCWGAFTEGQIDRMRIAVSTTRASYLTSPACVPVLADDAAVMEIISTDVCGALDLDMEYVLANYGSSTLTTADIEVYIDNVLVQSSTWTGSLAYGERDTTVLNTITTTAGDRDICIKASNPNTNTDGNSINDETCTTIFVDYYCSAAPLYHAYWLEDWSMNTTVDNLNNTSGSNTGFGNYISDTTDVAWGHPVVFTGTSGDIAALHNWYVFVDWNQDLDFDDADEMVYTGVSTGVHTGGFTIPNSALLGNTRMRVKMANAPSASPYSSPDFIYGEVEDYTLKIIDNGCYTLNTFPQEMGFETGLSGWGQSETDDIDWKRWSFTTPSNDTGPSSAAAGNYYIYTEASGNANAVAHLESPCLDFLNTVKPELSYTYHLYGLHVGTVNVQISTDGGTIWTTVASKTGNQEDFWFTEIVDLSAYAGMLVNIRLEGIVGATSSSDMAIDQILIRDAASTCLPSFTNPCSSGDYIDAVELGTINNAASACGDITTNYSNYFYTQNTEFLNRVPQQLTLTAGPIGQYMVALIDLNNDGDFSQANEFFDVGYAAANTAITQAIKINESILGARRLRVLSRQGMTPILQTDICTSFSEGEVEDYRIDITKGCSILYDTFPYSDSFESALTDWTQVATDDLDWLQGSGETSTLNTGPTAAYDQANYLYLESSDANIGYPFKIAQLISPCYDLTSTINPELSFAYHMYGSTMGDLSVEVTTDAGATWSAPLWTISGNQGNQWVLVTLNLSTYVNDVIQIRFTGTTGNFRRSDMAIDQVSINDNFSCVPDLDIVLTPVPDALYQSLGALTSSNSTIPNGGVVEYVSDTSIELTDGFCVELGAEFDAYIQSCVPLTAPVGQLSETEVLEEQ